tara:strand:+ start:103 stop:738 length:636 start_codon:yes stop_codon:yes gene_type:complete
MQEDHEDEGQKAFSALQAREKADVTAQVKSELEAAAAKAAAHFKFLTQEEQTTQTETIEAFAAYLAAQEAGATNADLAQKAESLFNVGAKAKGCQLAKADVQAMLTATTAALKAATKIDEEAQAEAEATAKDYVPPRKVAAHERVNKLARIALKAKYGADATEEAKEVLAEAATKALAALEAAKRADEEAQAKATKTGQEYDEADADADVD